MDGHFPSLKSVGAPEKCWIVALKVPNLVPPYLGISTYFHFTPLSTLSRNFTQIRLAFIDSKLISQYDEDWQLFVLMIIKSQFVIPLYDILSSFRYIQFYHIVFVIV